MQPSAKADISLTQSHLRAPEPLAVNIDEIVVRGYWTLVQYGSFVVQPFSAVTMCWLLYALRLTLPSELWIR